VQVLLFEQMVHYFILFVVLVKTCLLNSKGLPLFIRHAIVITVSFLSNDDATGGTPISGPQILPMLFWLQHQNWPPHMRLE
jgi:hypothetical protein